MPEKSIPLTPKLRVVSSVILPYNHSKRDNRKFIMVEEDGVWCPPGGTFDVSKDPDITRAATREVREETGLSVVLANFIGLYTFQSPNGNVVYNTAFSGLIESGDFVNSAHREDITRVDAFTLEQIRDMNDRKLLRSGYANVQMIEDFVRGRVFPLEVHQYIQI